MPTTNPILETALSYLAAGYSLIPIKADGSKGPALPTWKPFQTARPTESQVRFWFGKKDVPGIALVHGEVSGNSEVLDFETIRAWEEFAELCFDHDANDILNRVVLVSTPSGGVHVYYRCADGVGHNQKLALATDKKVKIETRGEGGYALAPGSPGACHPSGKEYLAHSGDICAPPTITSEERETLLALARACNEFIEPEHKAAVRKPREGETVSEGDYGNRPGDEYNRNQEGLPLLLARGWEVAGSRSDGVTLLRRPGKSDPGISGTYGLGGQPLFYCFSSNAHPFEQDKAYPPFSVYAMLEHGSDFAEAAKELGMRGYGDPPAQSFAANDWAGVTMKVGNGAKVSAAPTGNVATGNVATGNVATGDYGEETQAETSEDAKARERRERQERRDARGKKARQADDLPVIECNARHLRYKSDDALGALVRANEPPRLFARGGRMARVIIDDKNIPSVAFVTNDALRGRLSRVANFVSTSEDRGTVPITPPLDVVADLMSLPELAGLPSLDGVVTAPVVAPDGVLVLTPGYLPGAALFYHEPEPERPLPDTTPTPANIKAAKTLLLDTLLGDFPFVDEAGRAHALSLLLLPFVRPCIAGATPLYLIDAPTPGSGKGLLAKALTGVFTPGGATLTPGDVKDDDEWRKRITTALISGVSHLFFDNLNQRVDSGSLAAALTTRTWTDRLLGQNTQMTAPVRCVWLATGNNTQLSDEITRRAIYIRLDPQMERPWDRDGFGIPDLESWSEENRPALLAAALTLVRAWLEAGRPLWKQKPLGSFESWSRVLGGLLECVGVSGFLANRNELFEKADPERAKWGAFLHAWHGKFADALCGVADMYPLAVEADLCDGNEQKTRGEKNVLGRLLRSHEGKVVGNLRVVQAGTRNRAAQYQCKTVGGLAPDFEMTTPKANESNETNESIPPRTRNVPIFHAEDHSTDTRIEKETTHARAKIVSFVSFDSSSSLTLKEETEIEEKKEWVI